MHNIPIYTSEKSVDGLADKIMQCASIAYITSVCKADMEIREYIKSVASKGTNMSVIEALNTQASQTDADLYFTKSILVSTNWNKNDDVFCPKQTWVARHTPSHKPTNLEHDENKLVGHVVDSFAIDTDGKIISDDTSIDELPDKYHLVTGAVIYKNWESQDLKERTQTLIQAIEDGKKFVSMEVLFTDFDYAIGNADGSIKVKARNEETAWLTKHLRAYGGTGSYQDYKVGRLLKNMTFCGKGYVDKPANPESIIFSANNNFNFTTASEKLSLNRENGVELSRDNIVNNKGDMNMADEIYKDQVAKLECSVADLQNKLKEANDKLAKADVDKYIQQTDELTKAIETHKSEVADLTQRLSDMETKLAEATETIKTEQDIKSQLEVQLSEIKAAEMKANRISTLVDGSMNKDTAIAKVDIFANLSDEQFKVVADELINAIKTQTTANSSNDTETVVDDIADEEVDTTNADADKTLENVEVEAQAEMTVTDDQEDEAGTLRQALQNTIAQMLGYKQKDNEGDE